MKSFLKSFCYALHGIKFAVVTGRNLRIQLSVGVCMLAFAAVTLKTTAEWALLGLTIGAVICAECFNTAIEQICDFMCQQENIKIKIIKDISAAAVLLLSICAAGVGFFLFILNGRLKCILEFCFNNYWYDMILLAITVLGVVFISGIGMKRTEK